MQVRWKTTYLLHHGIHNYPAFGREYYDRQCQKFFLSIKNVHIDERVERIKIPHILMTITFLENTALIFFLHLHFKYLATSMLSFSLYYQLSTLLESPFPSTLSIQQSYLSQLLWPK